jgi:hypothetical protein
MSHVRDFLADERFTKELGTDGCFRVGYLAEFADGGGVECELGDTGIINPGVVVRSDTEANTFKYALRQAQVAAHWNNRVPSPLWSHERTREAIRAVLAWAKEPVDSESPRSGYSHHGISAGGSVAVSGRVVRLSFQGAMRAFYAYPEDDYQMSGWELPKYDGTVMRKLIADEVGADAVQEWNENRSMIFPIEVHESVATGFASNGFDQSYNGKKPKGWQ